MNTSIEWVDIWTLNQQLKHIITLGKINSYCEIKFVKTPPLRVVDFDFCQPYSNFSSLSIWSIFFWIGHFGTWKKVYPSLGSTSTFKIIIIFMIFNSLCNNYEGFQHLNFIFSQKIISTFKGLFNDEIDIRAM